MRLNQLNGRPRDVRIAAFLLWSAIGITCAMALADEMLVPQESWSTTFAIYAVSFGMGGLLVYFIWRRHNWARITGAVITVLGFLIALPTLAEELRTHPSSGVVTIVLVAMQIYAIYLLFTSSSNAWFKSST